MRALSVFFTLSLLTSGAFATNYTRTEYPPTAIESSITLSDVKLTIKGNGTVHYEDFGPFNQEGNGPSGLQPVENQNPALLIDFTYTTPSGYCDLNQSDETSNPYDCHMYETVFISQRLHDAIVHGEVKDLKSLVQVYPSTRKTYVIEHPQSHDELGCPFNYEGTGASVGPHCAIKDPSKFSTKSYPVVHFSVQDK